MKLRSYSGWSIPGCQRLGRILCCGIGDGTLVVCVQNSCKYFGELRTPYKCIPIPGLDADP